MGYANFSFLASISSLLIASVYGGPAWTPLCGNRILNTSNHSTLFSLHTSSGQQPTSNSSFCFCTVQSNHSFTLEIKRIKISTFPIPGNESQLNMFFTNGGKDNTSCGRINLLEVYNKPLDTDCLVAFSPNQSSSEHCWSNIRNVSAFGFYKNLSSYVNIYLTLKGAGTINTNCTNSTHPPPMFSMDNGCGEDNSSFSGVDTSTENLSTTTVQITSQSVSTDKYRRTSQQNEDNSFGIMEIGIMLASIGTGFLLISVFLVAITFRKRCSSKKEDASTNDNDVENVKMFSTVTMSTDNDSKILYKDNSECGKSPSLARNTSSLHDSGASKLCDDPTTRRYTEGQIDMEIQQELEKKPYYTAMKNLNKHDDEVATKQMLSNKTTSNEHHEKVDAIQKQQKSAVIYENELIQEPTEKNHMLHKSNDTEGSTRNQVLLDSMGRTSPNQSDVKGNCHDGSLKAIEEQETQPQNGLPDNERSLASIDDDNEEVIYENYSNEGNSETVPTGSPEGCSDDMEPYVNCSKVTNTKTDYKDSNPLTEEMCQEDSVDNSQGILNKQLQTEQQDEKTVSPSTKASSKQPSSDANSVPANQDKVEGDKGAKTLSDRKHQESGTPTLNSRCPPVSSNKEEPDYDTISTSSEGAAEPEKQRKTIINSNDKPSENNSRETENGNPVSRKESIKVIFLTPQPLSLEEKENLHLWQEADKKKSRAAKLKQTKSIDSDLRLESRIKPEKPKRSLSEDTFLKQPDVEFNNEGEHLYDEVDEDLKQSTSLTAKRSCEPPEGNETPFTGGQPENENVQNRCPMVDNDIYSVSNDAFETLTMDATRGLDKTNSHFDEAGLDEMTESDRQSITKM